MGGSTVHFKLISFFQDVTIPLISVAMEKLLYLTPFSNVQKLSLALKCLSVYQKLPGFDLWRHYTSRSAFQLLFLFMAMTF